MMLLSQFHWGKRSSRHQSSKRHPQIWNGRKNANCKSFEEVLSIEHYIDNFIVYRQRHSCPRKHCWNSFDCSASEFHWSWWVSRHGCASSFQLWCLWKTQNKVSLVCLFFSLNIHACSFIYLAVLDGTHLRANLARRAKVKTGEKLKWELLSLSSQAVCSTYLSQRKRNIKDRMDIWAKLLIPLVCMIWFKSREP